MAVTIWSGKSLLDQTTHICLHVTGLDKPSNNRKTGPMVQTWIMCKAERPATARYLGLDAAICGDCPHRAGSCYVTLAHAPAAIYRTAKPIEPGTSGALLVRGRAVRLGAYGDPAAVPFEVWAELLQFATSWTGYTHQWRTCDQRLQKYCMASVDSPQERDEAHDLGWRTFRVVEPGTWGARGEALCAASEHAINKLQCIQCGLCSGHGGRGTGDIFIHAHGSAGVMRAYRQNFLSEHSYPGGSHGPAFGVHQATLDPGGSSNGAVMAARVATDAIAPTETVDA